MVRDASIGSSFVSEIWEMLNRLKRINDDPAITFADRCKVKVRIDSYDAQGRITEDEARAFRNEYRRIVGDAWP
jgi:hypothetical protein